MRSFFLFLFFRKSLDKVFFKLLLFSIFGFQMQERQEAMREEIAEQDQTQTWLPEDLVLHACVGTLHTFAASTSFLKLICAII